MRFQTSLLAAVSLALLTHALPRDVTDSFDYELTLAEPSMLPESGEIVFEPLSFSIQEFGVGVDMEDMDAAIFDDWKSEVVKQHNAYRAQYGAPPLTWSDALYPGTLQWAQQCKFQHR